MKKKNKKPIDLKIKNYSIQDPIIEIDSKIPPLNFNMLCVDRSNCGKTNMLVNLLKHYKKYFKGNLIIFTKSRSGTLYLLKDKLDADIFHSLYDENGKNIINKMINYQNKLKEMGDKPEHLCILLDDWITDNSFDKKETLMISSFQLMGRHCLISTMITSQQFTLIPSNLRRMSWYNIIYKISNQTEKN